MTLKEILERKLAIKNSIQARGAEITSEEIEKFNKELDELEAQERSIKAKQDLEARMAGLNIPTEVVASTQERNQEQPNALAVRGKAYKARDGREVSLRSSTVNGTTSTGVLIPKHLDNNITAFPWNEVSSIVDLVTVISLPNGNEYTKAFQISTGEADYTLEPTKTGDSKADKDGVYNEVTTGFDSVSIKRNKITALTYESEESMLMPEADYATLIEGNVALSMKKKIAKEIVLGDGTGVHFVGMAPADSANMNTNTYKDVEKGIDENTVIDTLIEYGGEEDIEGRQAYLMNKLTLKEFARVRGSDKKPVYSITFDGNTAMIDGVRVVFTKHLKPFSQASSGDIWALYGDFSKYYMLDFGGDAIETSREFKFDQGITTVRGRVYAGGNIGAYKAITRLKKPATV